MLALAGTIAARAVALVPWAGPRATLTLLYVLGYGMAIVAPAGAVWLHMRGEVRLAAATCDAAWKLKLANAEREYAQLIATAQAEAAETPPVPADRAGVDRLCEQSPACRDRGGAVKGGR